jgi:hypothetical protein
MITNFEKSNKNHLNLLTIFLSELEWTTLPQSLKLLPTNFGISAWGISLNFLESVLINVCYDDPLTA